MQTKKSGFVFIVIGIIMIAYTGINFATAETVVDLGQIKINQDQNTPVQYSPMIGSVLLIGGIMMIARNKKRLGFNIYFK